jgi:glyoxylate/hydroxypyruvate/2-ketogluconate reductase
MNAADRPERPRVLVTIDTLPILAERLAQHADVELNPAATRLAPDVLRERMRDKAGAVICGSDRIDEALLCACPDLRAISSLAAGVNNIDLDACARRGIIVTNVPDVHAETVADLAWALMMTASRRVVEADAWLRRESWQGWEFGQFLGSDVFGKKLGLIGFGAIGQALARRAAGFGMQVRYFARNRLPGADETRLQAPLVSLDTLMQESDHVILTVPYSRETHHLIGRRELALMKASAILVNVARGGVIDDAALVEALESGRPAAAALDVFENEPRFDPRLRTLRNVVITPHIGSASLDTRQAMAVRAADNLIASLTASLAASLAAAHSRTST